MLVRPLGAYGVGRARGKAERTHVLRNFIIICVVIALLIVGVIILLSQP